MSREIVTKDDYLTGAEYWKGHDFSDLGVTRDEIPLFDGCRGTEGISEDQIKKVISNFHNSKKDCGINQANTLREGRFSVEDYEEGQFFRIRAEKLIRTFEGYSGNWVNYHADYDNWGVVLKGKATKQFIICGGFLEKRDEITVAKGVVESIPSSLVIGEVRHFTSDNLRLIPYHNLTRVKWVGLLKLVPNSGKRSGVWGVIQRLVPDLNILPQSV